MCASHFDTLAVVEESWQLYFGAFMQKLFDEIVIAVADCFVELVLVLLFVCLFLDIADLLFGEDVYVEWVC